MIHSKTLAQFLFLILNLFFSYANKVEIPIHLESKKDYPCIKVKFGENNEVEKALIDIGKKDSWINRSTKEGEENGEINYELFSVKGIKKKEKCILPLEKDEIPIEINDFSYIDAKSIIGDEDVKFSAVFGLGNGESDSNLKKIQNSNLNKKNFGFKLDLDKKPKLIVGDLFEEEKMSSTHFPSVPLVNKNGEKWEVKLKGLFIGNLDTSNNNKAYSLIKREDGSNEKFFNLTKFSGTLIERTMSFETIYDAIYVDASIFNFLEKYKYFGSEGKKELCKKNKEGKDDISYYCQKKDKEKLKNLNFIFENNVVLTLSSDDLLDCKSNDGEKDTCEFKLKYNKKFSNLVLGLPIIKNYKVYFMPNDGNIYFEGEEKIFKCDLSNVSFEVGKKDIKETFKELFRTVIVILALFFVLFSFFFIHEKTCGKDYMKKEEKKDENDKGVELVEK